MSSASSGSEAALLTRVVYGRLKCGRMTATGGTVNDEVHHHERLDCYPPRAAGG